MARNLFVASTGGHLEELVRLSRRLTPAPAAVSWVTFDDPQARSLLAGEDVRFVEYVPPRGYGPAVRNLRAAASILRGGRFDRLVTTGSGIALPFAFIASVRGLPCHYIESAARADGPSLTGRVIARAPRTKLYAQYRSWALGRWAFEGSLFDAYVAGEPATGRPAARVVVTLGTMRTFGFRRAVEAIAKVLPEVSAPDAEVLWQTGATDLSGTGIQGRERLPAKELSAAVQDADLVIGHAGIGTALHALDAGHCPVLLPRSAAHNEHVDDHQGMIAKDLAERRLCVACDPERLQPEHLWSALSRTVVTRSDLPPFRLAAA